VYSWPQADLPPEIRAASIAAGSAAAQRLGGPHDCAGRVVDALIEQAATADGLTRIAAEGTTPGSRPNRWLGYTEDAPWTACRRASGRRVTHISTGNPRACSQVKPGYCQQGSRTVSAASPDLDDT
jgi:hypothetical protein